MGTASWMWVRPILMIPSNSFSFFAKAWCRSWSSSTSFFPRSRVARWMPVGNASFVDWAMLTCEFGLMTSYLPFGLPRSSRARFAITSFAFMLIEVPAPPWIGSTMNHELSLPAMTSSAACAIAFASFGSRWPVSRFARAAAFFTIPIARISAGWIGSPVIGKFSAPRSVWTP